MRGRPFGLALLLLAAVLFRAAIPAGWMPNLARAGDAPIVICTGAGSELVQLHDAGPPHHPRSAERHDLCAFAGLGSAPAGASFALAAPARLARPASLTPAAEAVPRAPLRHREQSARAPPIAV